MTVVVKDRWAEYRRICLLGGLDPKEIEDAIAELQRESDCLDRGECPKCGGKVTRTLDPRQVGLSEVSGAWFNYRCGCGKLLVDRKEIVPETAS
jgi:hypothetical protein